MDSLISIFVLISVLSSATAHAGDYFQEGELQTGPFPNTSLIRSAPGLNNRVSGSPASAASASVSNYQYFDPFQISNCPACRERCTALRAIRYDCHHQNGLVVQCCCDGDQIWPQTCEQCLVGCPGYSTCDPGPNGRLLCTCSSAAATLMRVGGLLSTASHFLTVAAATAIWHVQKL